jgi:hypothetical protein
LLWKRLGRTSTTGDAVRCSQRAITGQVLPEYLPSAGDLPMTTPNYIARKHKVEVVCATCHIAMYAPYGVAYRCAHWHADHRRGHVVDIFDGDEVLGSFCFRERVTS